MRGPRSLVALTSGLLVAAAALHVVAAVQRWGGVCSFGPDDSFDCIVRGDHLYDPVFAYGEWTPIGMTPELIGLAMLMMAAALALLPTALGRRTTGFTRPVLGVAVAIQAAVGGITLAAGLLGHPVPFPVTATGFLYVLVLPFLIGTALLIPDGDDRPAGLVGGLVGWMMICTTPMVQFMVAPMLGGLAVDSSPWYEVMVAPFLLVAAGALVVGRLRQRSFSNQRLAHSLSL